MVYSKKRTFKWIRSRLDELKDRDKVYANEQFILVFGFVEKVLRRTFIELLRRQGVPDEWAQAISLKTNIPGLNTGWKRCVGHTLKSVIGIDAWNAIEEGSRLRNELIHGSGHRKMNTYEEQTKRLLKALDDTTTTFASRYKYDGWTAT